MGEKDGVEAGENKKERDGKVKRKKDEREEREMKMGRKGKI